MIITKDGESIKLRLISIIIIGIILILVGGIFYHFVEGWSFIDSLYFATISLTSRGFSQLHPTKTISLLFTILYLLFGVGFILASMSALIGYYINYYEPSLKRKLNQMIGNIMPDKKPQVNKWVVLKQKK
jgi:membrane-bound ClpP family serine protease